ncbi:MAG TPA: DNA internalization-related competence protein ComEC/Rec2 [Burkholderiaceae bacterium]
MRSAIIGFVIGICLLQMRAALLSSPLLWLLMAIAVPLGLLLRFVPILSRYSFVKFSSIALCGALVGFVWATLFAQHYLAQELPKDWEGREVTVVGTIDSLPYRFDQGVRFNFAVKRVLPINGEMPVIPPKISLAWYSAFRGEETQTVGDVQPGERWQLTVRLQRPHGNANPWGFDYEVWLLEQNLRATGYVRSDEKSVFKNQREDQFVASFGNVVERSRGWLRDRILAALPDKKYAGVIVALVVGDQRAVDQSDWKIFNRTGIGHLISISGLHITMVAGLFASAVFWLWRRSFFTRANLPLLLPAQKAAALAGAGMALLYVLLAGFGVPAQRTLYMLTVVAAALWFDRLTSVSYVLCVALGVVVLLDPWAVLWPGFWLSFGAVAMILYASVGRTQLHAGDAATRKGRWLMAFKSAAHTQYVVTLGLVPMTMLLFGQISLVSPIANAIAIPLVSFIVTPLALVGSVMPAPLSTWLLVIAHKVVEWLAIGLGWLSELPAAVWTAPMPAWWIFVFAFLGTVWLLAPRGWPSRWIGIAGWFPLLLNVPMHPKENTFWVTAFDVGQGMALLIETPRHRLLYDTGPYYSPASDAGSRVILPYLKARGIDKLDAVIVTHSDNDHSGGALSIFDGINVGWTSTSLPLDSAIVRAVPDHRRCQAGQSWTWDGVQFEMLHPTPASYDSTKWKPNARGCTLKVTLGAQSMLLAADIEAVQEDELVNSIPDKLRATVLLAPHHGSGTSSTEPFLLAVKPKLAVFQVGYRNRYHHPKPEVYERYGLMGIKRLRSDDAGAITLQFDSSMTFTEYRTEHARYWYGL